jgi:hypothetical protein
MNRKVPLQVKAFIKSVSEVFAGGFAARKYLRNLFVATIG